MAQSQILFYMHQRTMVPDHGTEYEENPSSYHGGMHKDGHPDWQTDQTLSYISQLCPGVMKNNTLKPQIETDIVYDNNLMENITCKTLWVVQIKKSTL